MGSLVGEATKSTDAQYSKGDLENTLSQTRTSWSCMLRYSQTAIVERLEHRLASVAGMPLGSLERMNMVRYAPGELFDEHHDGKFRPWTIFVYLNDLPEDDVEGDTYFPVLGLSFRPRRGTAVVWSNIIQNEFGEAKEDSRMLHAGRAPRGGVKYGVNCFFNVNTMRTLATTSGDISADDAVLVDAAGLGNGEARMGPVAYCLSKEPQLVCIPGLISAVEAEHLRSSVDAAVIQRAASAGGPFAGETRTLRVVGAGETEIVESVEEKIVMISGFEKDHLAKLRLVRPGVVAGLCNRGCGPKSAYVCLVERDDVLFTRLGIRLRLRCGDALLWSNVDWSTNECVEDIRTIRTHLGDGEKGVCIGLDAFFHDNKVRSQQEQRAFVCDEALAGA